MHGSVMKVSLIKAYDSSNFVYHGVEQKIDIYLHQRVVFLESILSALATAASWLIGRRCVILEGEEELGVLTVAICPERSTLERFLYFGYTFHRITSSKL